MVAGEHLGQQAGNEHVKCPKMICEDHDILHTKQCPQVAVKVNSSDEISSQEVKEGKSSTFY